MVCIVSIRRQERTRTYGEFGHFEQPFVIDNGTDDDSYAFLIGHLGHVLGDGAQRYRWTVDARHEQTFQHNLVEMGASSSSQITVQL